VKVLVVTCVWGGVAAQLAQAGHDVVSTRQWESDPGDEEVLRRVSLAHRVVITLDKDFGELAIVRGLPHSGILRLVGLKASEQGLVCLAVLESHRVELEAGAIITAEATRTRVRPAEGGQ
jgi:predicted nuclease of predicted toxin-antitoxin system